MYLTKYSPNDYIVYINKNELGKVKRVNNNVSGIFCWYHTGDTAACTPFCLVRVVLLDKDAREMSKEDIRTFLHEQQFSNDYAVDEIIEKRA